MKDIYDFFELIRKRPGMYIGENTVRNLRSVSDGYTFFPFFNEINTKKETPPFGLFHEYMGLACGWKSIGGYGWNSILIEEYGDGKECVGKFYEHLDNFKEKFGEMSNEDIIKYFDDNGYDVKMRFE